MKTSARYISSALLMAALAMPLHAQTLASGAQVEGAGIVRLRDSVVISMNIRLDSMKVESNRSVVLQPLLATDAKTAWLPAIEVMGRRRHLYYERNDHQVYAEGPVQVVKRQKGEEQCLTYRTALAYAPWMDNARLTVTEDLCGCGQVEENGETLLARADVAFVPRLAYVSPQAVTRKTRELRGTAYLDFPVNKTTIYPDYRRNPQELGKIRATIDTVRRNPKDYRITRISLRGYASPEGTYALNTRLSSGRTEAVRRYLVDCYDFADTLFALSHEPENWAGLRRYVEQSGLRDKNDILALIDRTDLQPDAKELELRTRHPQSYRLLLQECYPGLRRTDYRVDYVIRGFDVEEAKALVRTRPQDLSLQELFLVAQTYRPGSADFKQVFDVAVRMYPADPVANLNAANALLEQRLPEQALRYLDLAPACPEAQNARAVALILLRRYDEALPLLQAASSAGLQAAKTNIRILQLNDNQ